MFAFPLFSFVILSLGTGASTADEIWCTFEDGNACKGLEWETVWNIAVANTKPNNYAPLVDHTLGTGKGHYIYLTRADYKASIKTSEINVDVNTSKCFEFYYVLTGPAAHFLNVTLVAGDFIREIWFNVTGPQNGTWERGIVELPEDKYEIHVEASLKTDEHNGFLALDDVRLYDCIQNTTKPTPPPTTYPRCDFERGTCGFINDSLNVFDWLRGEAKTAHKGKEERPMKDHTTNSDYGHYMYAESTLDPSLYDEARLLMWHNVSVPNDMFDHFCVEFYYYYYGQTISSVYLYNLTEPGYTDIIGSFTPSPLPSTTWHRAVYRLTPGDLHMALSIYADQQTAEQVNLAIDDVRVYYCPMVKAPPVPHERYVTKLYCDFEDSLCGLRNATNQNMDWVRVQASNGTIPWNTHLNNNGSGHFLMLTVTENSSNIFEGTLLTPSLLTRQKWCLEFYYYMYGANITNTTNKQDISLDVTVQNNKIFQKDKDNIKQSWQLARAELLTFVGTSQSIKIEGSMKHREYKIAIDDVKIDSCERLPIETTTTQATTVTMITNYTGVTNGTTQHVTTATHVTNGTTKDVTTAIHVTNGTTKDVTTAIHVTNGTTKDVTTATHITNGTTHDITTVTMVSNSTSRMTNRTMHYDTTATPAFTTVTKVTTHSTTKTGGSSSLIWSVVTVTSGLIFTIVTLW